MQALEERITSEGTVLPGNVLKVGSFLNQQLDCDFLMKLGEEIADLFGNEGITKVLTVEASGIAIAVAAGAALHVPALFAKKHKTKNLGDSVYTAVVHSYTHGVDYDIMVDAEFLNSDDTVLIVDDFLASGNALVGLKQIVEQSGAKLAGCAVAIEKAFQNGGNMLRSQGVRVEALASVASMSDNALEFVRK